MHEDWSADSVSLLELPSPAVLTTYRRNGSAAVSPVWFRFHRADVEVVLAEGDVKLRHMERDPRCSLTIFEAEFPFRGVRVEGTPRLEPDDDNQARLGIASRYLGAERGRTFVDHRRTPGLVLRIQASAISEWDLTAILPPI
jgi:PPOX class probable F420-dependent enzyme